jgi:hypothetical protein
LTGRSFKKCGIPDELDGMEDTCLWDMDPDHMNSTNEDKTSGKEYM